MIFTLINTKKIRLKILNGRAISFFAALIFFSPALFSQSLIKSSLELQSIGTGNHVVPFWMRSNQFGYVPNEGLSVSAIGSSKKNYQNDSVSDINSGFDWAYGLQARANVGEKSNALLIEAFAKVKFSILEFKAGRSKDIMGLGGDQALSSGNFSISGNALGIPKIELSIPHYFTLPIFHGIFAVKGQFAHGWLGKEEVLGQGEYNRNQYFYPETYFHQKSLYGRIGRENSKFKGYAGFNHQVFWGNEKTFYGDDFKLNGTQTFWYVLSGKAYENPGKILSSKIGNQIGSIDLGLEYNFRNTKLFVYRQNFYDVGALAKLANIQDGLNGISLENKNEKRKGFAWRKVLFEFLYTKNQAGYPTSKATKSGDENYYNNDYYTKGWSYYGQGLGTPFITPTHTARAGQLAAPQYYFLNNRVVALHTGMEMQLNDWTAKLKVSYSWNYGTFLTSPYGISTGPVRYPSYGIFQKVKQFSGYFSTEKRLSSKYFAGIDLAFDSGKLLDRSLAGLFKLRREF